MMWRSFNPILSLSPWNELNTLNRMLQSTESQEVSKNENGESTPAKRVAISTPRFLMWENDAMFFLTLDMPGVKEDSLTVDFEGSVLTVRGTAAVELPEGFTPSEYDYPSTRSYERQVTLGDGIDAGSISASLKNGLLSLTLPKVKRAQTRKIEVRAS